MTTEMNAQANDELEMFEFSIDDLPDLPEFVTWPVGTYSVEGVSLKRRDIEIGDDTRAAIELTVKLESIVAFKPATATLPEVGSTQSWSFFLEGKDERSTNFAQGKIKQLMAPFKTLTGGSGSLPEIARTIPGAKFNIVTDIRTSKLSDEAKKNGEEAKVYSGIKNLFLA
jgi:hypothetical protein